MARPPTVQGKLYHSRLAENLRALIDHQAESVNEWSKRWSLPQSTINKVASGQRGATVALLEQIEEKTGFTAWQLVHPDFDPKAMPPMADARALRVAAIYANIKAPILRDKAEAVMEQFADDQPNAPVAGTIPAPPQRQ